MNTYSNSTATPGLDKMLRLMKEAEAIALTKKLYVESKFTDGKLYCVKDTRVIIGPPVNDFDVNTAQAIIDGYDILWLADDDMAQRAAKLAQYGMGNDWCFPAAKKFTVTWAEPPGIRLTLPKRTRGRK